MCRIYIILLLSKIKNFFLDFIKKDFIIKNITFLSGMNQKNLEVCKKNINYKEFFTKKKEFITIEELNKLVKIENIDKLNLNAKIFNITSLKRAKNEEISFISNIKYLKDLKETQAGFCFIQEKFIDKLNEKTKAVIVKNPHYAFSVLLNYFFFIPLFSIENSISQKATIGTNVKIGKNVEIQAGVYIDDNVIIGDNCKISANSVINHNVKIANGVFIGSNTTISYAEIGEDTIIQNNVAIGHCGFGFSHNNGFNYKIPQLGIVRIGKFVEIFAGTTIARGAIEDTIIEDNVKIDSLCQIAHGVKIGKGCFLAGQTGIAGSTEIGMFCQMGGQSGVVGHLKVGNFNTLAARTLIMKDTKDNEQLGGYPATKFKDWLKERIILKKLIKKVKNDE